MFYVLAPPRVNIAYCYNTSLNRNDGFNKMLSMQPLFLKIAWSGSLPIKDYYFQTGLCYYIATFKLVLMSETLHYLTF